MSHSKRLLTRLKENIQKEEKTKHEVIKQLNIIADELDVKHRDMNIANVSFAAGGVLSSGLTIAGIIAAPFTFGASLGLTVAGAVIGGTSGLGGAATYIAKQIINKKTLKNAQTAFEQYQDVVKNLYDLVDELQSLGPRELGQLLKENRSNDVNDPDKICEIIIEGLRGGVGFGDVEGAAISGTRLSASASQIGVATAKTIGEIFESGVKGLKIGGLVLSVLTVPVDVYSIVTTSIKIHKMTPSETAQEIRRLAKHLRYSAKIQEKEKALVGLHQAALKYDRVDWPVSKFKLLLLFIQIYGIVLIAMGLSSLILRMSFDHLIRFGTVVVIQSGVLALCLEMYIEVESSLVWPHAKDELDGIMRKNFRDNGDEDFTVIRNMYSEFKINVENGKYPLTNYRDFILIAVKLTLDTLGLCYTFNSRNSINLITEISTEMVPLRGALALLGQEEQEHHTPELIHLGGAMVFLLTLPMCLFALLISVAEMYGRTKTKFREGIDELIDDFRQKIQQIYCME